MIASAATRPGCVSGSGSLPRCCAPPVCCCSTSPPAASIRPARGRSRRSSASCPPTAWRSCSRATRSASSSGSARASPSCAADGSSGTGPAASWMTRRPASAFELSTSDDARALQLARRARGPAGAAVAARRYRTDRARRAARPLRARARRRADRDPPSGAARQPAGEHVLCADLGGHRARGARPQRVRRSGAGRAHDVRLPRRSSPATPSAQASASATFTPPSCRSCARS